MPYTVSITADEAHLLTEAKVDGVEGTIFTYAPNDSLEIIEIVSQLTDPETLGLQRLSDRLQTLYGTYLTAVARKRESEQANDDDVFAVREDYTIDEVPSPAPQDAPTIAAAVRKRRN